MTLTLGTADWSLIWSAIGAIATTLGFTAAAVYAWLTWKLLRVQQETYRLANQPHVATSQLQYGWSSTGEFLLNFSVKNGGNAPAHQVCAVMQIEGYDPEFPYSPVNSVAYPGVLLPGDAYEVNNVCRLVRQSAVLGNEKCRMGIWINVRFSSSDGTPFDFHATYEYSGSDNTLRPLKSYISKNAPPLWIKSVFTGEQVDPRFMIGWKPPSESFRSRLRRARLKLRRVRPAEANNSGKPTSVAPFT
jgi:hypothetical protein